MKKYVEVSVNGERYRYPLEAICDDLEITESEISDISIVVSDGVWDQTLHIETKNRFGQIGNELEYNVEHLQLKIKWQPQSSVNITAHPPSDHPIYQVIRQLLSWDHLLIGLCSVWNESYADLSQRPMLKKQYENDLESLLWEIIELNSLGFNTYPEQPSEEIPPEQLKAFGNKYGVEFAPEDARDPLVYAIWQKWKPAHFVHPIHKVIKQIVSTHEVICEVFERMDGGDVFQYVQDNLEEHYESDPESFLQDAIDFRLLNVNSDLDQANEETYLSPDQLKDFGDKYHVTFAPEDARDPLVIEVWRSYH